MKTTEICLTNVWCKTGGMWADLKDEFWNHCDNESIDAPEGFPTGSAIENVVDGRRFSIPDVIFRF